MWKIIEFLDEDNSRPTLPWKQVLLECPKGHRFYRFSDMSHARWVCAGCSEGLNIVKVPDHIKIQVELLLNNGI